MTQPILRILIQEKLVNGRSPRIQIPRIRGGPRNGKGLLRGLTLAAFAVLSTMTFVVSAGAVTAITSCPTALSTFGETYVLTSDPKTNPDRILTSCDTCLTVANDRVTIDLAGHTIIGFCGGAGVTDDGIGVQGTTVKNGTITGFGVGVALGASARTVIRNLEVSDNVSHGLLLGLRSLAKGCLIQGNGGDGIIIGEFGQVQDCTIGGPDAADGNGGFGIFGASHLLITRNTVVGNQSGIVVVGELSTVSFNTSSGNTFFGVFAAGKHLITSNITNGKGPGNAISGLSPVSDNISTENGAVGVQAVGVQASCPSTVTNNRSSGNSSMDYNIGFDSIGTGCQTSNNK
jgi:hypothetical protein